MSVITAEVLVYLPKSLRVVCCAVCLPLLVRDSAAFNGASAAFDDQVAGTVGKLLAVGAGSRIVGGLGPYYSLADHGADDARAVAAGASAHDVDAP